MSSGLLEFYPQIKAVHIACVLASGSLFAIRRAAVLSGARWPLALPVRWLSYAISSSRSRTVHAMPAQPKGLKKTRMEMKSSDSLHYRYCEMNTRPRLRANPFSKSLKASLTTDSR